MMWLEKPLILFQWGFLCSRITSFTFYFIVWILNIFVSLEMGFLRGAYDFILIRYLVFWKIIYFFNFKLKNMFDYEIKFFKTFASFDMYVLFEPSFAIYIFEKQGMKCNLYLRIYKYYLFSKYFYYF